MMPKATAKPTKTAAKAAPSRTPKVTQPKPDPRQRQLPFERDESSLERALKESFKIPKTLAECADLLYTLRAQRAAEQRLVTTYDEQMAVLKEKLIAELPKSKAGGIAGRVARVTLLSEPIPTVEDWSKFYRHLQKTGDFSLMQKRLSAPAIEERWAAKKVVPGVGRFTVIKVSVEKL